MDEDYEKQGLEKAREALFWGFGLGVLGWVIIGCVVIPFMR